MLLMCLNNIDKFFEYFHERKFYKIITYFFNNFLIRVERYYFIIVN